MPRGCNARFIARGKAPKAIHPVIEWQGLRWVRDHQGYYRCRKRGPFYGKRLHREMYILANGPIPDDKDVDHIDQDKENNTLENLALMPKKEHGRKSRAHQTATRGAQ